MLGFLKGDFRSVKQCCRTMIKTVIGSASGAPHFAVVAFLFQSGDDRNERFSRGTKRSRLTEAQSAEESEFSSCGNSFLESVQQAEDFNPDVPGLEVKSQIRPTSTSSSL